ncbi:hypothetical protein ACFL47_10830, partial [Candidatus Latescibacterota bacterium]
MEKIGILRYRVTLCISFCLIMVISSPFILADDTTPVKIAFDQNAKRLDLVTGKEVPSYTLAQRGSVQFFFSRL